MTALFVRPENVIAALVAAFGFALILSALAGWRPAGGRRIAERLRELGGEAGESFTGFARAPILDRLLRPTVERAGRGLAAAAGDVDRDARLLLQAGYPSPFHSPGDLYGWKVILAVFFLTMGLIGAAVVGEPVLAAVALVLGVFGLYVPDLALRNRAKARQELFRTSLAFSMDHLAMLVEVGETAEEAIRHLAANGRGLFARKMQEVVQDLNLGEPLVEALERLKEEFPLDEYELFVNAVALNVTQGVPLATTLGQQAENIMTDLEADLLAKGLRAVIPMTLGMALAVVGFMVLLGAPLVSQFFGW